MFISRPICGFCESSPRWSRRPAHLVIDSANIWVAFRHLTVSWLLGITEDWKRLTEILLCFTATTTSREERIYIVDSFGTSRELRNHKIGNTIKPHWIQPPFLFENKQTNKTALGCREVHSATQPLEVRWETPITPIPHPELPLWKQVDFPGVCESIYNPFCFQSRAHKSGDQGCCLVSDMRTGKQPEEALPRKCHHSFDVYSLCKIFLILCIGSNEKCIVF